MLKDLYHFTSQLILRAPTRPFTLTIDATSVQAALADAQFMEAIYLASPALHAECAKWQRGERPNTRKQARLQNTLVRYYARMSSRCTPFGLFAGCSVVEWGHASTIRLALNQLGRHTRLDMHYLCALAQELAAHPEVKRRLRYFPNSTLYVSGWTLRYVEHHYTESGECLHQLSAVDSSASVLAVVAAAQKGITGPELVANLLENEAERAAVECFIDDLIRAQILVSELAPTVTGVEYFSHLRCTLNELLVGVPNSLVHNLAYLLDRVQEQLQTLDQPGTNAAAAYENIVATLVPVGVPIEPSKLFQTDATLALTSGVLNDGLQSTLYDALEVLNCLTPHFSNPRLTNFARRFQARYEEQEVCLLEALDSESGLSYAGYADSRYSALVHDLVLPEPNRLEPPLDHSAPQQFLRRKLQQALGQQQYAIDISLAELRTQKIEPAAQPLPPSIGVLFRVVDAERVLLESADGSSAVNLLGRFAHVTAGIEALVQQVTAHEQAQNPAVAFAEVCHLPASRIGNLLQRPHFRALEIPYLAHSTLPAAGQVAVQDLLLSVYKGQLRLRSRKTNQFIVPRLSSAHNFNAPNALPVYQFLCDLQTQGLRANLSFTWQGLAQDAKFLPRLTSGRAVLAAASWRLTESDLHELLTAAPTEFAARFAEFRAVWQLPRFFTLADGDNELLVDAENELLVRVWREAVQNLPSVLLREFLFESAASPVCDEEGQPYVPQFIALLVRQGPSYPAEEFKLKAPACVLPRSFSLGSEWLYYKLYCGQLVADSILLEVIRPLAAELLTQGLIDNWFFVRYADPDNHLRVRWHLPNPSHVGKVVQRVAKYLVPFSSNQVIWKIQADTYQRELERYGGEGIEPAEALFGYQSQALLDHMAEAPEYDPADLWLWGLAATQELLSAFGYSLAEKLVLVQELKEGFARELGLTKALKRQLDGKYRAVRAAIDHALDRTDLPIAAPLVAIASMVQALLQSGRLPVAKNDLMGSYVHMLWNRILPADARLHELVVYDFMYRYYQSAWARQTA